MFVEDDVKVDVQDNVEDVVEDNVEDVGRNPSSGRPAMPGGQAQARVSGGTGIHQRPGPTVACLLWNT
jgi:hypothetical protein